ncbi:MAG: hypothetical protein R2844_14305 [Caldilineales bacterium]
MRQGRLQGSAVETYQFPAQLGLPHDVIDPNQTEQKVDEVYPVLVELITGTESGTKPGPGQGAKQRANQLRHLSAICG